MYICQVIHTQHLFNSIGINPVHLWGSPVSFYTIIHSLSHAITNNKLYLLLHYILVGTFNTYFIHREISSVSPSVSKEKIKSPNTKIDKTVLTNPDLRHEMRLWKRERILQRSDTFPVIQHRPVTEKNAYIRYRDSSACRDNNCNDRMVLEGRKKCISFFKRDLTKYKSN